MSQPDGNTRPNTPHLPVSLTHHILNKASIHDWFTLNLVNNEWKNNVQNYLKWIADAYTYTEKKIYNYKPKDDEEVVDLCLLIGSTNDSNEQIVLLSNEQKIDGITTITVPKDTLNVYEFPKDDNKTKEVLRILGILNKYKSFCNLECFKIKNEISDVASPQQKIILELEYKVWEKYLKLFDTLIKNIRNIPTQGANVGGKPRRRSFESLTVPQLKEYAKRKEIRGYSKLNKAELIAALRKTRK